MVLVAGAPVDTRCCTGDTPLHLAARGRKPGHAECMRKLLARGADPTATNRNGKAAIDLAHRSLHDLLRAHLPPPPPEAPAYILVEQPDGEHACINLGPGGSLPPVVGGAATSPIVTGWADAMEAFTGFSSARDSRRGRSNSR